MAYYACFECDRITIALAEIVELQDRVAYYRAQLAHYRERVTALVKALPSTSLATVPYSVGDDVDVDEMLRNTGALR